MFQRKSRKPQIWNVSLSQNGAKMGKINRPNQNAKFPAISPLRSQENAGYCKFHMFH